MNTHSRSWLAIIILSGILLSVLFLSLPTRAAGPWYVAPSGSDSDDCLAPGTPCETINGAIGKASPGDTIYVATGTYTNSTDAEVVLISEKAITLSGGWDVTFTTQNGMSTIDGEGTRRGIRVSGACESGVIVVIDRFVVQNGTATPGNFGGIGGGILNSLALTLNRSVARNNSASGRGGGIANIGQLTVNDSTITNNTATLGGGGIADIGGGCSISYLNNSTISGNVVSGDGITPGIGGGIYSNSFVNINNSTVSGNSASDNGGGIGENGAVNVTLRNTILAGNTTAGTGPDCSATLTSQGYNLIQDTDDCTITGITTGNLTGVDPLLGPLQDNGSPTLTQALLQGSPAIDAGNPATPGGGGNACEATDQRGIARPQFAACDIGAFELSTPMVQFDNNFSVIENAGTAVITVMLIEALTQTATVDYSTSDGTALAGSDYVSITGTLTFTPSVITQTFSVTITDDVLNEANETVALTLSNPTNVILGPPNPATLTIVDNEPTVQFSESSFDVNENAGTATITVTLDMSSALTVTVDYFTSDGTATAGSDYVPIAGTLTFPPGVTTQTFQVTITDDVPDEVNETLTLTLSNPTNVTLGPPNPATLTIVDDDPPTIQFSQGAFNVDEYTGTATITVTLEANSALTVTVVVDYATSDGTATAGSDYLPSSGTLVFPPGVTTQTFAVTITDDALSEGNETVPLTLSNVVNAVLGVPDSATLKIVDNDFIAYLPLISKPFPGINGLVTLNGTPISGVSLELRFFNGSTWSTFTTTTTGADGRYAFLNIPGLGASQKYYVLFLNDEEIFGRLGIWGTRELTSYATGSSASIGDFDIADIALLTPADGATVNLPYMFQWTPRPASPTDIYEFDLYDFFTLNPYFYTVVGYTGGYTLNSLPPGFAENTFYVWDIWAYSPDGGFGISYELRVVYFSSTGLNFLTIEHPSLPKTMQELEGLRKR